MIYLYTEKKEDAGWILKNDWFFNLYTSNEPLTERDKSIIQKIDGAKVADGYRIETKYGLGTLRNLSSGCKTLLNIVKNPGRVVSAEECGRNVLEEIFLLDDIRIFMSRPERFRIDGAVEICFNGTDTAAGRCGYEQWWSGEYERRAADDL